MLLCLYIFHGSLKRKSIFQGEITPQPLHYIFSLVVSTLKRFNQLAYGLFL